MNSARTLPCTLPGIFPGIFQSWAANRSVRFMLMALAAFLSVQSMMAQTTRPAPAASFTVIANGENMGSFKRAFIPNNTAAEVEERESGRQAVKRVPGKSQPGKITLGQGDSQSAQSIYTWYREATQGNPLKAHRNVTLILRAADGKQVARYELKEAWPSKLMMGSLGAKGNSAAVETLELEYESIARVE